MEQIKLSDNSLTILEKRYLAKDENGHTIETPEEMFLRVAKTVASAEKLYGKNDEEIGLLANEFYRMMADLEFLPNSPTLMNAGRPLGQLSACFVLPVEDSMEGIFDAIKNAALIHKSGGGTGFSFSRLRPANDIVKSTRGVSSGPVSFMRVFDSATEAIKQGGTRRGANMGVLRIDHPDIRSFVTCKLDRRSFPNFNISVSVTDDFMKKMRVDEEYQLINPRTNQPTKNEKAKDIFNLIVETAWTTGDPGIIFIDQINKANPLQSIAQIESTNPCGEQPLFPYESCNLGSINLALMVSEVEGRFVIDFDRLRRVVWSSVRFLDDVIDMNRYPLEEIEQMTKGNRKIGLGVMGFADMLILLGIAYDSDEALKVADDVMRFVSDEARACSVALGKDKGSFPNFEKSTFFGKYPYLRNATLTTIAPTGTISMIASCSSGIEPIFSVVYVKHVLDGTDLVEVNPHFEKYARAKGFYTEDVMKKVAEKGSVRGMESIPEDVQKIFVSAHDIAPETHVRIQAAFQKYVDNAVSKTVNLESDATKEDVARIYLLAHDLGCKGVTIYRDKSKDTQVISFGLGESKEKTMTKPRDRPPITRGFTYKIRTGCGNLYVTINEDENGLCEVFTTMGKSGGCMNSFAEGLSRLISLSLRSGVDPRAIVEQLKGIRCPIPTWSEGVQVLSCSHAISLTMEMRLDGRLKEQESLLKYSESSSRRGEEKDSSDDANVERKDFLNGMPPTCPECGAPVQYSEGCLSCPACGYSACS